MVKRLSVKYEVFEGSKMIIKLLTVVDDETGRGKIISGQEADELYKKLTEED